MFSTPQIQQFDNSSNSSTPKKPWFLIAVIALLVVLLAVSIILYYQSRKQIISLQQKIEELEKNPSVGGSTDAQTAQLLSEVGQLIVLPTDEQPTVATVEDLTQLAGQPFFAQAVIGDKVIIYSKAAKAILYRPSEKKVINIAPIVNDSAQPQTTPAETAPAS